MPTFLEWDEANAVCELPKLGALGRTFHVFDPRSVQAINAALASGRPLLLRGEPGTGKSQLARAAAQRLGRAFVSTVVDARTEAEDLQYEFDTVARLAEAQIQGALGVRDSAAVRESLAEERFLSPGPLWWAFDWAEAKTYPKPSGTAEPPQPVGWKPEAGVVMLLDEIDKADSSVPNGLLECLAQGYFRVPGGKTVAATPAAPPLIVVTTNEERALPDAFLRRCLVHHLAWPTEERELRRALVRWGAAHYGSRAAEKVLERAAELLAKDRDAARDLDLNPPGGAEYLDLLRALAERYPGRTKEQLAWLEEIARFALRKHPEVAGP
ncbi:MAG TPA: MoxR family ATPase [Thermoanaerobaculia bacterium]|nr:MoxR family ATPase [Thermoanaerobaculia bacterium]